MDKKQKIIFIVAGIVEVAIIAFCLTVSIRVLATFNSEWTAQELIANNGPFIGGLQTNNTLFLLTIVLPLFVILALDIIYLIVYATKRESALSDKERDAIEAQAKEEARLEVLREMEEEAKQEEAAPSEKKAE